MRSILVILLLTLVHSTLVASTIDQKQFRSFVNLANYVANDYVNAVDNGLVINEFEYAEMQEFVQTMQALHEALDDQVNKSSFSDLEDELLQLSQAIEMKASVSEVEALSNHIAEVLLAQNILSNVPPQEPSIAKGQDLYQMYCANCHGEQGRGDGPASIGLEPAPSNFLETQHIFPFHIYNTVQLGIEGTSMVAQAHLTEQETWDIAFYLMTLTFENEPKNTEAIGDLLLTADLSDRANFNNAKLASLFDGEMDKVQALRFYNGELGKDESLDLTLSMLRESMDLYHTGEIESANQKALDAYFIGFEPVEIEIGATHPGKVQMIESEMIAFRSLLTEPNQDTLLKEQYEKIAYHLENIRKDEDNNGFWFTFFASISIMIREGLEALLIIIAILAALNTFSAGEQAKKYVHGGWVSAVLIGLIGFFFTGKLLALGSHKRELIEGFGAILAVVILLSVGFWLHDKSNAMSWNNYIKSKLSKHLDANSLLSIGVLAFVVVFREAFESVIFLSSLSVSGGEQAGLAVILGTAVSAAFIGFLGLLMLKYSKKLPIHQVFKISSITMIVLAVILAGKGVHELQEAGMVNVNLLGTWNLDMLGIYPTIETFTAQILTLAIALGLMYLNKRKAAKLATTA